MIASCLAINADVWLRGMDDPMSDEESLAYHEKQVRAAAKLGFPVVRYQWGAGPRVIRKLVALAGDWDPLEWRLEMTRGQEPWQRVLLKLKEVAGFTTDLPRGEGMGLAVVEDHGSICGACATVSVTRGGLLSVEKVVLVMNCGYVINPRGGAEQMEGSVCYELSHALYGGLGLKGGQIVTRNFDTYNLMRMPQMPKVEVHFALSEDGWWGGIGEPGGPPTPPAVANAIYFATGKRIRSTPIAKHDLNWG